MNLRIDDNEKLIEVDNSRFNIEDFKYYLDILIKIENKCNDIMDCKSCKYNNIVSTYCIFNIDSDELDENEKHKLIEIIKEEIDNDKF